MVKPSDRAGKWKEKVECYIKQGGCLDFTEKASWDEGICHVGVWAEPAASQRNYPL